MSLKRLASIALAGAAVVAGLAGADSAGANVPVRGTFTAVDPARVLDTRDGTGVWDHRAAKVGGGEMVELDVTGVAGAPDEGVGAVVLNVTVTNAADGGFVTAFPCGHARPLASNLNFLRGVDVANQITAKVGEAGHVCLFSSTATDLVADLSGWYADDFAAAPGRLYEQLTPARIVDTRDGTGLGTRPAGRLATGEVLAVTIPGAGGVPADAELAAVTMNITIADATDAGFITAFPCDRARPWASNVNFDATNSTVANLATIRTSASGQVCFYASTPTSLIVDVQGYFSPTSSARYDALDPVRVLDTRDGTGITGSHPARAGAGEIVQVTVAGHNGVPADAAAVLLNVTITQAAGRGYVTAWPCGHPRPLASFLNYVRGVDQANLTPVRIGEGGKVCLFVHDGTEIVADLNGYYESLVG